MKIKKFKKFCESISGTEVMGVIGTVYGEEQLPITLNKTQTNVVYSYLTNKFYTESDYDDLYQNYLKNGGKTLFGFNRENLDIILSFNEN